jgi:branched-chain amino acid transport system permease protein
MQANNIPKIIRWNAVSITAVSAVLIGQILLAFAPLFLSANVVDKLTTLFIYGILALMWNALAGYAGLLSIGHQAFFGLGAYATVRLADVGMNAYPAMLLAAFLVALVSVPVSFFMLRLKEGEFAIGMWVMASLAHLLVNLDTLRCSSMMQTLVELTPTGQHWV